MQTVLAFQLRGDALAAAMDEILVQPPAILVHIDGDDMQVPIFAAANNKFSTAAPIVCISA